MAKWNVLLLRKNIRNFKSSAFKPFFIFIYLKKLKVRESNCLVNRQAAGSRQQAAGSRQNAVLRTLSAPTSSLVSFKRVHASATLYPVSFTFVYTKVLAIDE